MTVAALCMILTFFPAGMVPQEGPQTGEEWDFLLQELMIRMAEENEWEESFPEEFTDPESSPSENETETGESLLRLLLDENTDMETRLMILERLRTAEDPEVMEEVLKAFAESERKNGSRETVAGTSGGRADEPRIKLRTLSRQVVPGEEKPDPSENPDKPRVRWINIIVGGLALTMAAAFFFLRRGLTR